MPKLNTFFRAFLIIICFAAMLSPAAAREDIPPAPRELRGLWVATVSNLDWPSSRNLSTEQAKAELVELFDLAQELNMNAVVFQVRPAGDAFYPSPWEPWSAYLTGKQGRAPEPAWDPLQFAIDEAHRRAMELHVWLNPFRASVGNAITSDQHISKRRPDLVHTYGNKLWMDPGEPEAQNYVLNIISDLLKRYDFDALHFDDYFYPYPESGVDFPDDTAWRKYQASGGTLSRDDWRRANVNDFIRRTSELIRSKGDGTRFGVSPFGIWQPGHPPGIRGMNPYNALYADSRLWLQKGWVDYLSPQLYWSIDSGGQSYTDLLAWWTASEQNPMKRHVWPGLALYRIDENKYDAEEILN